MFYEVLGRLIDRAGILLEADVVPAVTEPNLRMQVASTAQLLRDIAVIWPDLFGALEHENEVLGQLYEDQPYAVNQDPMQRHRVLSRVLGDELEGMSISRNPESERFAQLRAAIRRIAEIEDALLGNRAA